MRILNLGCGTRTCREFVNIDFTPAVRLKTNPIGRLAARFALRGERWERYNALTGEVVVHDLRKGIPADTSSVDAVYHSHVLEHLDRVGDDLVPGFFAEIHRVLKPGGVHRIVVPDFSTLCRDYLAHLDQCIEQQEIPASHDEYVGAIITQMVRREAYGTSLQRPIRRRVENLVLGDARRRAETHQWMYDEVNLAHALLVAGFLGPHVVDHRTSAVPRWDEYGVDRNPDGSAYKPGSLYMEASK